MANTFFCNSTNTVVTTKAGLLRGFSFNSLYHFYGIKYANAVRFRRPTEVEPWEGVRDALCYGPVCPLLRHSIPGTGELKIPHRYWPEDEDCQYLNIWTSSLDPTAKKPVMVWLHGGGFYEGSSISQPAFDGSALSLFGDVVVVTLNHRLNILGFFDLSPYGEQYDNSANVGLEDIVYALRWLRDNIAQFGGDPDNVTLFGQSGGGAKIHALMQTPDADGLFHKGILQSGVIDAFNEKSTTKDVTLGYEQPMDPGPIVEALVAELCLTDVSELETVPYPKLAAAYNKVSPVLMDSGCYVGNGPIPNSFFRGFASSCGFTEHAKTIPLIVGTCINEYKGFFAPTSNKAIEKDGRGVIADIFGEQHADRLIDLYREAFPGKSLRGLADMDFVFRGPTVRFLARRVEEALAPSYSYMLTVDFDIDGPVGAWHCSDIPFAFHNLDLIPYANIPGGKNLEDQICSAWVSFARSGDPNHPGLPAWPACVKGDEACMIFDLDCELRHNHDHALMAAFAACGQKT